MEKLIALRNLVQIKPGVDRLPASLDSRLRHVRARSEFYAFAESFLLDCQAGVAVSVDLELEHKYSKLNLPKDHRKYALLVIGNTAGDVLVLDLPAFKAELDKRRKRVATNLVDVVPGAIVKLLTSPDVVLVGSGIENDFGPSFKEVFGWTPTAPMACTQRLFRRFGERLFGVDVDLNTPVGLGFVSHHILQYDYKMKTLEGFRRRYVVFGPLKPFSNNEPVYMYAVIRVRKLKAGNSNCQTES